MSSQTSWIIRHNCTMVCGGGSLDLIWQSVKSLGCVRWGIGRWKCWPGQCMDCIWSEEVLCEVDWKRKCVISSRSGALHHGAAYSGWGPTPYGRRARSVNRLIWLRMVCVDIRTLWRPGASETVLVDSLHWSRRCRCLRQKCQSCDDVIPGSSPLRGGSNLWQAMSQPQNCCHIETSGAICTPQVGLQHTQSPFSVDEDDALASYYLLEWSVSAISSLQMITNVQMHGLIPWTSQVKMFHSESIS